MADPLCCEDNGRQNIDAALFKMVLIRHLYIQRTAEKRKCKRSGQRMIRMGESKRKFAYEAHTACDKHGFMMETVVAPGNSEDSAAFGKVYSKVIERIQKTEAIVADSAYKSPPVCRNMSEDCRFCPQLTGAPGPARADMNGGNMYITSIMIACAAGFTNKNYFLVFCFSSPN